MRVLGPALVHGSRVRVLGPALVHGSRVRVMGPAIVHGTSVGCGGHRSCMGPVWPVAVAVRRSF